MHRVPNTEPLSGIPTLARIISELHQTKAAFLVVAFLCQIITPRGQQLPISCFENVHEAGNPAETQTKTLQAPTTLRLRRHSAPTAVCSREGDGWLQEDSRHGAE